MRFLIVFAVSLLLVLACSDSDSTGGTGGVAGSGGGTGGDAGARGNEAAAARAFVLYSPEPPCAEGAESDYRVEFIGDTDVIQEIRGSSTQCTGFEGVESFTTITCANDPAGIDYSLEVTDVEEVAISGTFEACAGFYQLFGAFEAPPSWPPFVDLYIRPDPPCEENVPSDYIVTFLIDGQPGIPENASVELSGCTGALDSAHNTVTCPNEASYDYTIDAGEGERRVQLRGSLESCSAHLLTHLQ